MTLVLCIHRVPFLKKYLKNEESAITKNIIHILIKTIPKHGHSYYLFSTILACLSSDSFCFISKVA